MEGQRSLYYLYYQSYCSLLLIARLQRMKNVTIPILIRLHLPTWRAYRCSNRKSTERIITLISNMYVLPKNQSTTSNSQKI